MRVDAAEERRARREKKREGKQQTALKFCRQQVENAVALARLSSGIEDMCVTNRLSDWWIAGWMNQLGKSKQQQQQQNTTMRLSLDKQESAASQVQ